MAKRMTVELTIRRVPLETIRQRAAWKAAHDILGRWLVEIALERKAVSCQQNSMAQVTEE